MAWVSLCAGPGLPGSADTVQFLVGLLSWAPSWLLRLDDWALACSRGFHHYLGASSSPTPQKLLPAVSTWVGWHPHLCLSPYLPACPSQCLLVSYISSVPWFLSHRCKTSGLTLSLTLPLLLSPMQQPARLISIASIPPTASLSM